MLKRTKVCLDRQSGGLHLYMPMDMAAKLGWHAHESIVLNARNVELKGIVYFSSATQLRKSRDEAY